MANPQIENGHVKIATELFDALVKIRIPGEARQVFDAIIRKTYGWNKLTDRISISQYQQVTGMAKSSIIRAIKKLITMNMIVYQKVNDCLPKSKFTVYQKVNDVSEYSINKDFEQWKPFTKKNTVYQKVNDCLPKSKFTVYQKVTHKRHYTKDTIQKTNTPPTPKGADDRFETLWQEYPKKIGKVIALKSFQKIKPDKELFDKMIATIQKARNCEQWSKDSGQFIPHLSTWLNQGRWDDVIDDSLTGDRRQDKLMELEDRSVLTMRTGKPETENLKFPENKKSIEEYYHNWIRWKEEQKERKAQNERDKIQSS
jgi:phage replication O-like protein O